MLRITGRQWSEAQVRVDAAVSNLLKILRETGQCLEVFYSFNNTAGSAVLFNAELLPHPCFRVSFRKRLRRQGHFHGHT